jgi:gamma-glutamylcyclotransferase (GGCT)/AIG2-like uncharacterized protein YtfP
MVWPNTNQEFASIPLDSNKLEPKDIQKDTLDTLFVYGSLFNDKYFQILTGQSLPNEPGELFDHRRVQPKNSFAFAIPWKGSRITGKLLTGVTPAILKKLDEYENEGRFYHRLVGLCKTEHGVVQAYIYVGDPKALRGYIKRGFSERDRIEEFVEKQVAGYLENKADRCMLMDRKYLAFLVTRELLSEEIESILQQQFTDARVPKFIIKHEIENANLPSLDWVKDDHKAQRYAGDYMALTTKFMVFNQLEERFRNDYRGQVTTSDAFYHRTLSGLMAFKLLTDRQDQLLASMEQLHVNGYTDDQTYTDYAVAAIMIANELYNQQVSDEIVHWVKSNRYHGIQPIGAELEFSDLGKYAIAAGEHQDPKYDSFYYFYNFDLMRRGWKLGAHVDDHGFLTTTDTRTRGFLELAFGRYRLLGDISKPATMDPWVLAQMIKLAVQYIEIKPHSLHISIETSPDKPFRKLDDPLHLVCLLMLGGDLQIDDDGHLRETRIFNREIKPPDVGVCISRLNKHHQNPDDQQWSSVVEYQFPRLLANHDYQPLIMALKGFQTGANPYPFKGVKDSPYTRYYEEVEKELIQWAAEPVAVSQSVLFSFLSLVARGLEEESGKAGPEYKEYSKTVLDKIETLLRNRNQMVAEHNKS